jgi:hypothetical protein
MSIVPIIIRPHLVPFFFKESEGVFSLTSTPKLLRTIETNTVKII